MLSDKGCILLVVVDDTATWLEEEALSLDKIGAAQTIGFSGGASGKESACQCRRRRFDP